MLGQCLSVPRVFQIFTDQREENSRKVGGPLEVDRAEG